MKLFRFCESLHPDLRNNELAIDLIVLILLFDSNRDALLDPADRITVVRHRQEYQALLHRYECILIHIYFLIMHDFHIYNR